MLDNEIPSILKYYHLGTIAKYIVPRNISSRFSSNSGAYVSLLLVIDIDWGASDCMEVVPDAKRLNNDIIIF